jgi:hypothetical protein
MCWTPNGIDTFGTSTGIEATREMMRRWSGGLKNLRFEAGRSAISAIRWVVRLEAPPLQRAEQLTHSFRARFTLTTRAIGIVGAWPL